MADSVLCHSCRNRLRMEWSGMERNIVGCQWMTLVIGRTYDFHVFGTQFEKGNDVDLFGAWEFDGGFGKMCVVESITGFIG